ncbi:hypothetical protein [Bradyrhizobium iriomotense]|uniref:Uncharacterized protein n=1 Tax=Bradyrhizobium iriomotense TaxID=441950 RepID=A0ABQ6B9N7_9BRAD|nr:hypothetical protein [Bradyrhizobium iriomotense]GLR88898.1 hypothetical protein GCM10007857_56110 [Bradyrhizobium iriomotense]
MTTASDRNTTTTIAVPDQARTTVMPRIRFSRRGAAIDHPDPDVGERLMVEAFGVADRDAMYGILRQLVRASMAGTRPDPTSLAFMLSMVQSIKPRDAIEAMLVAQMVSVHVLTMRWTCQLGRANDLAQQESATRALGRLARTFPAQMEALNRYRSKDEPAITVQNLSVQDGGKAIVGNVTQHASVMVADQRSPVAIANARTVPMQELGERELDAVHATRAARA